MARGDGWKEWQREYVHGTFVIWPPDGERARVNELRGRYDPVSQRVCDAHVTVTQPLRRAPSVDDWRRLAAVVAAVPAFRVDYGPLGTFLPYPCIWFAVQPVERVLSLRTTLHATGLFDLGSPHPERFLPHMTITEGMSGPPVDHALFEQLQATIEGGSFECTSLAHIVPDDDFRFAVAGRLPLRRPASS